MKGNVPETTMMERRALSVQDEISPILKSTLGNPTLASIVVVDNVIGQEMWMHPLEVFP